MENKGQNKQNFIELRNNTIYLLYTQSKLRFTDISKLEVQHISDDFCTIRVIRGKKIFKVAISKEIAENLQLLCMTRDDKEKVFYSDRAPRGLSRTMVQNVVTKLEGKPLKSFGYGSDFREEPSQSKYHTRKIP